MTVEPFTIPAHLEEAAWVRERVAAFRFFEEPADAGWRYGASRPYMERLRDYWLTVFDWPTWVERLNRHPHVRVEVEPGFHLHALHRRSSRADARPLLIAHGWPGSIIEFAALVDRLAEPTSPADPAFHVVAPSLPGYAWSDKPASPLGPRRVAALYATLMDRLGYHRFVAQGGDWGSAVAGWLGFDCPAVDAIHLNGFGLRAPGMRAETPEEERWFAWGQRIAATELGYFQLQGTRPQSLGFAMMDSPMGVAAWFAEKFTAWTDTRAMAAPEPPIGMDVLLANVMIYLTTRSFNTATWIYRGLFDDRGADMAGLPDGARITVSTGIARFPEDLLAFPPRRLVELSYNVAHWTDMPRGGHFASLEEPELFLADLRAFVRGL